MILTSLDQVVTAVPQRRALIGIAGAPGAGKSTLAAQLADRLDNAVLLPMDGFHLPQARLAELGRRERMGAPDTFDVDGFTATLAAVKHSGRTVLAPDFDRTIEEPVPDAIVIRPEVSTVVVEGNYLLLWERARALLDVTFFVDLDHGTRVQRLVDRHVRFGKSVDDATAWALGPDEHNARLVGATAHLADHRVVL